MKDFLISPPFGNWLHSRHCTRVLGSFTWERRAGLIYHTLRSLRPIPGGWVNEIGLRNRGIRAVTFDPQHIYSVVGLNDGDWESILDHMRGAVLQPYPKGLYVEVNLGCPNVHKYRIPPEVLREYCKAFTVIAKLPPIDPISELAAMCHESGVSYLHCCNTIPTLRGGESGRRLFGVTLPIVARLAARYPGQIIAGGGIYDTETLQRYRDAGATRFSLATVWLTPWRVPSIIRNPTEGGDYAV